MIFLIPPFSYGTLPLSGSKANFFGLENLRTKLARLTGDETAMFFLRGGLRFMAQVGIFSLNIVRS
jgi:hypothetical protein